MNWIIRMPAIRLFGGKAEREPVVDRHLHDRVDAVDVHPVREQEQDHRPVLAHLAERAQQLCEAFARGARQRRSADRLPRPLGRSSGTANSSHHTATVRNEARIAASGLARPNSAGFAIHHDVDDQQQRRRRDSPANSRSPKPNRCAPAARRGSASSRRRSARPRSRPRRSRTAAAACTHRPCRRMPATQSARRRWR